MNNKILTVVLVAGIATTGFTALSSADDTGTGSSMRGNTEIRELLEKSRSGETLTTEEQARLEEVKANFKNKKGHGGFGKRKGLKNLTDEEKEALDSMTDEEKKAFFDGKKEEMKAQKEAHKAVIDALIAGETLTPEQETLRGEMLDKIENGDGKFGKRDGAEIIEKILRGEVLTTEEQEELQEMQEKHAEREAQREVLKAVKDKLDAGEELTDEEQALLDAAKQEHRGKKGRR